MKKVLIIAEEGNVSELTKVFNENGIDTVCENTDFLYKNVESSFFDGIDAMIYSGNTPSYVKIAFERSKNVGIKRAVLIGSALTYFDRVLPDMKLDAHAYVHNANLCVNEAAVNAKDFSVSIVLLPFIDGNYPTEFNTVKGAVGIDAGKFFFAPEGGIAEITAENAAKAVYAVTVNGENGVEYPVCDKCRKYKDVLREKVGAEAKIYEYPVEFAPLTAFYKKRELKKANINPQYDVKVLNAETLTKNLYFDATEVKKALKYDELFENQKNECLSDTESI